MSAELTLSDPFCAAMVSAAAGQQSIQPNVSVSSVPSRPRRAPAIGAAVMVPCNASSLQRKEYCGEAGSPGLVSLHDCAGISEDNGGHRARKMC